MTETPRNRVIETVTSSAKHRPPLFPGDSDPHAPFMFPKHDRKIRIFSNLVAGGILIFGVLFADFGPQEHCFSGIRRYVFGKVSSLLTISKEDDVYIKGRIEEIQNKLAQVEAKKKKQANILQ